MKMFALLVEWRNRLELSMNATASWSAAVLCRLGMALRLGRRLLLLLRPFWQEGGMRKAPVADRFAIKKWDCPACEGTKGLFPLPTSLRAAYSSRGRRSKACHPERSLRSEGPHNTAQNVPLSMALSKQTTFLFWAVQWTPAPSFAASVWVVLVRLREILRFEDCAQDDKIGAPFWLPSPVTKLVGNGKRGLQHSKTLARLRLRLRLRRCAREFAHFRRSDRSTGKRVSEENHERS